MINSMDKDKLYRYFEGIASAEEMQEIRSWAEGNEEHEALLRRERKLFDESRRHSLNQCVGLLGNASGALRQTSYDI